MVSNKITRMESYSMFLFDKNHFIETVYVYFILIHSTLLYFILFYS